MTPDEIRADFERWATKEHGSRFSLLRVSNPESQFVGEYAVMDEQITFEAYSAAHAAAERRLEVVATDAYRLGREHALRGIFAPQMALSGLKGEK